MKRQPSILAGTALGLLMASAPLGAYPLQVSKPSSPTHRVGSMLPTFVQADCLEGETAEDCAARVEQSSEQAAPAAEEAPPAEEPAAEEAPAPAEPAPAETEPAPAEAEPAPAESEPAPAESEPAEAAQPEAPAAEQPATEVAPAQVEQAPTEAAPSEEAPTDAAPAEEVPADTAPTEAAPAEQSPAEAAPAEEAPAEAAQPEAPAAEQPVEEEQPADAEAPAAADQPAQAGDETVNPDEAPLLDSQKEEPRKGGRKNRQNAEQAAEPVDQGPPPESDAAATQAAQPANIEAATTEKGTRVRPDEEKKRRRERPEGTDVLREIGNRLIIELGDQVIVESDDRPRMTRGARDVYYEDLPRGRTRETIERKNGVRIVTVRNRYGDVIRRARITPDGREYVLVYVDENNYDRVRDWRDPGDDLPPMRLNIPRRQYILDSEDVEGPDDYYEFLEQPPVEKVQRLYSIDEVKRSARVRDIARRVDLDTLTFEFGSATIPESEIGKLEGVATAMGRLLESNPAETFLIEGHTDAVGSDTANLALSDRRAEAVAEALTNVFDIPPENLAPQGYGERYLKVDSAEPERQNRRVAIRRITPLVAPVASAN